MRHRRDRGGARRSRMGTGRGPRHRAHAGWRRDRRRRRPHGPARAVGVRGRRGGRRLSKARPGGPEGAADPELDPEDGFDLYLDLDDLEEDDDELEVLDAPERDAETHRGAFGEFGGESGAFIERTFRERIVVVGVTLGGSDPERTEADLDELGLLV